MNLSPLNDSVLVRIEEAPQPADGIILPQIGDNINAKGVVLAVGKGIRKEDGTRVPIDLVVGDRIFFSKYATSAVAYKADDGEILYLIKEGDVHGTLTEEGYTI